MLFNKFKLLAYALLSSTLISGCSETKSASTPVILGGGIGIAFIDVPYISEFGADGGGNLLTYRIASGPSWINLEQKNGAKNSFSISGNPDLANKAALETFEGREDQIIIEVSDGSKSSQSEFIIDVQPNEVTFELGGSDSDLDVTEGVVAEPLDPEEYDEQCIKPDLSPQNINGQLAYPLPIKMTLSGPPASRTEIRYELDSTYDSAQPESSKSNKNKARPGVDYLDTGGSVVFQPGVQSCLIAVYIYDDAVVEIDETFSVKLVETVDGWGTIQNTSPLVVNIEDDEPVIFFPSGSDLITEGNEKTYTLTLSEAVDYPISTKILVDSLSSATEDDDYKITIGGVDCESSSDLDLNTCNLTFAKNTTSADFKVVAKNDDPSLDEGVHDETIFISSDISEKLDYGALSISINEWFDDVLVAGSASSDSVKALEVDINGNVFVPRETGSPSQVQVDMYDRKGTTINFTAIAADAIIATTDAKNVTIGGLGMYGSRYDLAVAVNTDGEIDGANLGEFDVYIRLYKKDSFVGSEYGISWSKPLASDKNDIANGSEIDSKGNVYVYGYTEGSFDNDYTNAGGKDAFLAKFDSRGTKEWVRYVASSADEQIVSLDFLGNDIVVAGITDGGLAGSSNGGDDGFIAHFDKTGKQLALNQFGSSLNDNVANVKTVSSGKQVWVSGDSQGEFIVPEGGIFDPAISRNSSDIFSLNYTAQQASFNSSIQWGDNVVDEVVTSAASTIDTLFIGGATPGELETDGKVGLALDDAFISTVNEGSFESNLPVWNSQFGTLGDDKVLDMKVLSKNKIIVLWQTIDAGVTRYLISAFRVSDGAKESDLP